MSAVTSSIGERDYRLLAVLICALSGLAWLALWRFGESPYVHYLHHAYLVPALPGAEARLAGLIFIGGWMLMTVAMMLPTSVPLLGIYYRIAATRRDRPLLVALVVAGYLLVWGGFGLLAYAGAVGFRETTAHSVWLRANLWVLGAGTLLVAGAYQFSSFKYRCLDKCRSPFSFVIAHWTGERHWRQALWLGVHHGLFCVGCCWSLMLLMFPFGAGNIGWMLVLGLLMAIEKNVSWGRRFGKPLGVVLLTLGLVVILV